MENSQSSEHLLLCGINIWGVLLSSLWDEVLSSFWQSLAMRRHYSPWFLRLLCSIEWVCQVGKIRWWGWWLRQGSNFEIIIQSSLLPPDQLHYHYLYHYSNGWACLCLHSSDTSIATLRISLKISCSIWMYGVRDTKCQAPMEEKNLVLKPIATLRAYFWVLC